MSEPRVCVCVCGRCSVCRLLQSTDSQGSAGGSPLISFFFSNPLTVTITGSIVLNQLGCFCERMW
jgi:hypothetical protein